MRTVSSCGGERGEQNIAFLQTKRRVGENQGGVEIRKQNIPVRQTMEIYRQAVGYLTEIYAQVWEELRKIPETKKRFNQIK